MLTKGHSAQSLVAADNTYQMMISSYVNPKFSSRWLTLHSSWNTEKRQKMNDLVDRRNALTWLLTRTEVRPITGIITELGPLEMFIREFSNSKITSSFNWESLFSLSQKQQYRRMSKLTNSTNNNFQSECCKSHAGVLVVFFHLSVICWLVWSRFTGGRWRLWLQKSWGQRIHRSSSGCCRVSPPAFVVYEGMHLYGYVLDVRKERVIITGTKQ